MVWSWAQWTGHKHKSHPVPRLLVHPCHHLFRFPCVPASLQAPAPDGDTFNVFFSNYAPKGALPLMENLEEREDYGVSKPEQFTWKQLLDGYACTECGRCNTVCPATNTGKPLFPKEIILGVKEALFVQSNQILGENTLWSKLGVAGVKADKTAEEKAAHHEPMVGGIISTDALWACTSCSACMEICPVSIEHVPTIIRIQRHLE